VAWFCQFLTAFQSALTQKLIELETRGHSTPAKRWCWLFFGAAGRGELLAPVAPCGAIVFGDECSVEEARWFDELALRVRESYAACGLMPPRTPTSLPSIARSIGSWNDIYRKLLEDPLMEGIHQRRAIFDFRCAAGDATVGHDLRAELERRLADSSMAVALLGHDCLAHFPPLTLFQNVVVDIDGTRSNALDLWRNGIEPLADVARVLALAAAEDASGSTIERLTRAAGRYPQHAESMLEAAAAFRVLLLEQCRTGISGSNDGSIVYPAVLSRYEHLLLKNAFRSVLRLMQFTYANAFTLKS